MTPSLPSKLQVGSHTFEVTDDKKKMQKMLKDLDLDTENTLGLSNQRTGQVFVRPDMHFSQLQDTLLHEVLHCVWRYQSWDTPKKIDEEGIVQRMTPVLLDMLQRNPEILSFLLYQPQELTEIKGEPTINEVSK